MGWILIIILFMFRTLALDVTYRVLLVRIACLHLADARTSVPTLGCCFWCSLLWPSTSLYSNEHPLVGTLVRASASLCSITKCRDTRSSVRAANEQGNFRIKDASQPLRGCLIIALSTPVCSRCAHTNWGYE